MLRCFRSIGYVVGVGVEVLQRLFERGAEALDAPGGVAYVLAEVLLDAGWLPQQAALAGQRGGLGVVREDPEIGLELRSDPDRILLPQLRAVNLRILVARRVEKKKSSGV